MLRQVRSHSNASCCNNLRAVTPRAVLKKLFSLELLLEPPSVVTGNVDVVQGNQGNVDFTRSVLRYFDPSSRSQQSAGYYEHHRAC